MTSDPARDGMNWYNYAGSDPVNAWDPMGLDYIHVNDKNEVYWVAAGRASTWWNKNNGNAGERMIHLGKAVYTGHGGAWDVKLDGGGSVNLARLKDQAYYGSYSDARSKEEFSAYVQEQVGGNINFFTDNNGKYFANRFNEANTYAVPAGKVAAASPAIIFGAGPAWNVVYKATTYLYVAGSNFVATNITAASAAEATTATLSWLGLYLLGTDENARHDFAAGGVVNPGGHLGLLDDMASSAYQGASTAINGSIESVDDVFSWARSFRNRFSVPSKALIPDSNFVARIKGKLNLYPKVIDPRTGRHVQFPSGITGKVPKANRVPWGGNERGAFIKEWYDRGLSTPRGGWDKYDIHHIQPREFGGANDFWNLVPVERGTHQSQFNAFWREFMEL